MKQLKFLAWCGCLVSLISIIGVLIYPDVRPVYSPFPLGDVRIVIDPGHGGMDGASYGGILEKDLALMVSLRLRDHLTLQGATVTLTRDEDNYLGDADSTTLREKKRSDIVNRAKLIQSEQPDLAVSIHLNAIDEPVWRGAQTFYYPTNEEGQLLAEKIQTSLVKRLKNTSRTSLPISQVYLLKVTEQPMALVELGFLSNDEERHLLLTTAYQEKLAISIFYGIIDYLSSKDKE